MKLNEYLDKAKKSKASKMLTLPQLLNDANASGCKCTIEELSEKLWNLYC